MKKIRVILVILFAMIFVSGCSCSQSMCNEEDLTAIKESITEKWKNDTKYIGKLEEEAATKDIVDATEVQNYINQNIEKRIEEEYNSHPKACLTTVNMVDPDSGANIGAKTWGGAFKQGLLEGLIVFPISWLLITFSSLFGSTGAANVWAIVVATIIIKLFMLLITFKQQIQTQRLQAIQPELNDISKKISDPNISPNEKYKLQMKMLDLYKKNDINPLATIVPTLLSFPIFLSVWSAVSQTLVIRTGKFMGIELGKVVSSQIIGLNIGAIVLFLFMSALQVLSMKLPDIIRKVQNKDKKQPETANNQMKTMMNVMMAMILITGFMLPAALAIYWTVGALFSIVQTLIFQSPTVKQKLSSLSNRKKKAKVVQ